MKLTQCRFGALCVAALGATSVLGAPPSRFVRQADITSDLPEIVAIVPDVVPLEIAKDSALADAAKADVELALRERQGDSQAAALRQELNAQVAELEGVENDKANAEVALSDGLYNLAETVNEATSELRNAKNAVAEELSKSEVQVQRQMDDTSSVVDQATLAALSSGNPKAAQAVQQRDDQISRLEKEKRNLVQDALQQLASLQAMGTTEAVSKALSTVQSKIDDNLKKMQQVNQKFGQTMIDLAAGKLKLADQTVDAAKEKMSQVADKAKGALLKLHEDANRKFDQAEKVFLQKKEDIIKKADALKTNFSEKVLPELKDRVGRAQQHIKDTLSRLVTPSEEENGKAA